MAAHDTSLIYEIRGTFITAVLILGATCQKMCITLQPTAAMAHISLHVCPSVIRNQLEHCKDSLKMCSGDSFHSLALKGCSYSCTRLCLILGRLLIGKSELDTFCSSSVTKSSPHATYKLGIEFNHALLRHEPSCATSG